MELHELIRRCLSDNREITEGLGVFDNAPAIFILDAPSPDNPGWNGKAPYPRIVFTVEMWMDKERKCQGVMNLTLSSERDREYDLSKAALAVGKFLGSVILNPDGEMPCSLGWNQGKGYTRDGSVDSIGMCFEILEHPCQNTMDPDPIDGMNVFLKGKYPEALVLWHDHMGQVEKLLPGRPVFYCSLESDSEDYSTMAVVYMNCSISIHVFADSPGLGTNYSRAIARELVLEGDFDLPCATPFFITSVSQGRAGDSRGSGPVQGGDLRKTGYAEAEGSHGAGQMLEGGSYGTAQVRTGGSHGAGQVRAGGSCGTGQVLAGGSYGTAQVQVLGSYGILRRTEEKKRITKTEINGTGG